MLTAQAREPEARPAITDSFAAGARLFLDRDPTIDELLRAGFTAREIGAHLDRRAEQPAR